ncbi:hypothetical protein F5X96DRAFT_668272 [Biscogniauxia mediterranea]|nr:hypothetical protein F5X96DRAFT_668272 [Biscogniauxia mediterranea]
MNPMHSIAHSTTTTGSPGTTIEGQQLMSANPEPQPQQGSGGASGPRFADLPPELREMIWKFALPETRTFNALVYASATLKMQLLNRDGLKMPLAHVCFESRRVVKEAGYVLAFRDEDQPEDPGVWFHPQRDMIERTIWGPGDFWGIK